MKVIYLTGAPAVGKSSALEKLQEAEPSIFSFEYGAELAKLIRRRDQSIVDHKMLRTQSAAVVRPEDIDALDTMLLNQVDGLRGKRHVIINSHPVTKEVYGFRITAFSQQTVQHLRPDEIWVLYTAPRVIRERIKREPGGRSVVTEEEARMHSTTQTSVAVTYGIMTGAPVYLFDTDQDQETLVETLLVRLAE